MEDEDLDQLGACDVTSVIDDLTLKINDSRLKKDLENDETVFPLNDEDVSMVIPDPIPFLSSEAFLCHFTEDSLCPSNFFPEDSPFSKLSNDDFKTMVVRGILVFPSSCVSLHKQLSDFCFFKLSVTDDQKLGEALGKYLAREVVAVELSFNLFARILANWGLEELREYKPKGVCCPRPQDGRTPLQEHNLLVLPFMTCCADTFDASRATRMLTYLMKLLFDPILLCKSIYVFKPISILIEVLNRNGTLDEFFMGWDLEGTPPKNFFYLFNFLDGREKADLLLKLGYKFVCKFFSQEYDPSTDVTVDALCNTFLLGHEQLFGGKVSILCSLLSIYEYLIQIIPPAKSDYKPLQEFMTSLQRLSSEYSGDGSSYYKERVQCLMEVCRLRLIPFHENVEFHFRVKLFNPSADYLGEEEN